MAACQGVITRCTAAVSQTRHGGLQRQHVARTAVPPPAKAHTHTARHALSAPHQAR